MPSVIRARLIATDIIDKAQEARVSERLQQIGFELTSPKNNSPTRDKDRNEIWSPIKLQECLEEISKIGGNIWKYDSLLLAKYIEQLTIRIVRESLLSEPMIISQATLKSQSIILPLDNKEIWPLCCAMMDLTAQLGGISGLAAHKPNTPFLADFSVLMEKQEFEKLFDIGKEIAESLSKAGTTILDTRVKDLSKEFRASEPVTFSQINQNIDPHSFLISSGNLAYTFGLVTQPGIARLRMPYMTTLTYDKPLIENRPPFFGVGVALLRSYYDLLWAGAEGISLLLAVLEWTDSLEAECWGIDEEMKQLRAKLKPNSLDIELDLTKLSEIGIRVASFFGELERVRESLKQTLSLLSEGKENFSIEVPIFPDTSYFPDTLEVSSYGYLKSLALAITDRFSHLATRFRSQERQVRLLQSHVSDIVNLKATRSNVKLSSDVRRLTWVLVFLTSVLVVLAVLGLFKL